MESEADLGCGMLSAEIGLRRRRSASVSDDYSVQKTNDDATESKFIAVQQKYYSDDFIGSFIYACADVGHHRDPEIMRGYWARTAAITSLVTQFIQTAGPSAQIINLGAGFDTLYWRLKSGGFNFYKFVEFDFSSVTAKKIRQIRRNKNVDLCSFFKKTPVENQHSDFHAGDYHLIGADLRQMREFEQKLSTSDLDTSQPTLVIAECLFVYMDQQHSQELLEELAKIFESLAVINYEQVNMTDTFSKVMLDNLNNRGINLPGLPVCKSLFTQKQRFLNAGFNSVNAWTVNDIYNNFLPSDEIKRIEKLEPLDEKELLSQLLEHYCLVYAFKDSTKNREKLEQLIVR